MKKEKLGAPLLRIQIRFEPDIVTVRQKTRRLAGLLGFENQDQARLATAVSELARNIFQYAKAGSIEFYFDTNEPQTLYVRAIDQGPGIEDLQDILNGTYNSKSGMGIGLMGSKKLMDFFAIYSDKGNGTQITIGKSLDKRAKRIKVEDLTRTIDQLAVKTADNAFEEIQNQNRDLLAALEELQVRKEELGDLNRELAETNRGVVALYAELDEKAESLQRANEVKTSFLSHMTHEFRTPLSSIISLTRLLLNRVDGELTEEQERQVKYICQSSEGLLELVNDLLDLAKVEAGKVTIIAATFSLEELLGGIRGMFRPLIGTDSTVDLYIEPIAENILLSTDQAKISQILRNLVSNALKFTEKGSVTISTEAVEDQKIHFKVTDTGIGISEDSIKIIFEDFGQVESTLQKRQKGTGLGLPLSRKLARLLGGELWVESKPGSGSVFHVCIPRFYTGAEEGVLISSKESEHTNKNPTGSLFNVLLVDDDEPSRYVLKEMVASELDANFIESSSGVEAFKKLKLQKPDLVFLDLNMPEMNGFELLKKMRSDKALSDLPVIVNTAKKLSGPESDFLRNETTAVLTKERTDQHMAIRDLRRALVKAGFDYRNM